MNSLIKLVLAVVLCAGACAKSPDESIEDMGMAVDTGRTDDVSGGADSNMSGSDSALHVDMRGDAPDATHGDMQLIVTADESEPNDASTLDEVDDLAVATVMRANIDASDTDTFRVDARPGLLYRVTVTLDANSQLQPHITVFDAGRGGDPPADDYVKIVRGESLSFLAMGDGGNYVVIRDGRNVDGAAVGGAGFGYTVVVNEFEPSLEARPLTFGGAALTGSLDGPGGVDLWAFDGTEGMNVVFDFDAAGDLDGRLFVFAVSEGSWIARQDDRTTGNPNPLLDAPLFASGAMYLVVESIAEEATSPGYTIDASSP